jgi:hypothetical protein
MPSPYMCQRCGLILAASPMPEAAANAPTKCSACGGELKSRELPTDPELKIPLWVSLLALPWDVAIVVAVVATLIVGYWTW